MTFTWWLLPAAMLLHMLEEVIWLPLWSQTAGAWHPVVGGRAFSFASAVVVVLFAAAAWAAQLGGRESLGAYLTAGLAVLMLINFFVPHAGAALHLRTYAPGIITSAFVMVPVSLFVIQQALAQGFISILLFVGASVVTVGVAAVIWPWLLGLGRPPLAAVE